MGRKFVKDQQVMGDSNAGAIAEGGLASTGNDVGGAGVRDRARIDAPPAKERVQVESKNRAGVDGLTTKDRQVKIYSPNT